MEYVELKWSGPYDVSQVPKDWGIYAICRCWGKADEKVLYIGLTYFQDLVRRLKQHNWWLEEIRGNVRVRFGAVELEEGRNQSEKRAKDVEALLIYRQQPEHNTQHKKSYRGRELVITNRGRHGPIQNRIRSRKAGFEYQEVD